MVRVGWPWLVKVGAGGVAVLFKIWADAVGVPAPVTGVVAEVIGRPARSFREWASDHRDAFLSQ